MSKSVDLSVRMGDITFKNPFIVGAGPTAKTVDQIKAARAGRASADRAAGFTEGCPPGRAASIARAW